MIVVDIQDGNGPIKLVNPVLVKEEGTQVAEEGCLSIPEHYAKVERPATVVVKALNENGEEVEITATEIMAVVLSHELDHLEGKLFIDKMIEGSLEIIKNDGGENA